MKTAAILLAILAAWPVCQSPGQMPTAVITGPKESRPGSLVVLDATESQGLGRTWLLAVSPEPTSFWMPESRLQLLFASPTPGDYTFVLVVAGTNANGGPAAVMATHTVRLLGATPPPVVVVPPIVEPPVTPPVVTPAADRATYVYEKDDGTVPAGVATGLAKLNAQGIVASEFEVDTVTGTGSVPAQYFLAREAAIKAGLPCLVVQAGAVVVRTVKDPQTEAAVLEGAR